MKNIIIILLVAVLVLTAFCACSSERDELADRYNVQFFRDGYSAGLSAIADGVGKSEKSENFSKLEQGNGHLPIHKIESFDELKSFKNDIVGSNISDSLKEYFDKLDGKFFEKNILLAVNLTSGSGSYRFRVSSVTKTDGCFAVGVSRVDTGTQIVTCDMAYWLVMCEVERTELSGITEFDAVYEGVN